ncbi:methyltransferase, FxLD system [Stackebrandtia nassauensis]|uniref:Protein-L-isoaspartate O-methyltransferase n=1 Tax=Stackebrandtia nassauensis (strain DSM 44728 / CIP 108903 / NRRL B-16338 / NBRC 102104 / LLR-40K-21) TaxID=446470 RepID=D3PVS6_STANL|nr:methyltransferase, FxLD system [Stackebrandtia nassauensis]ADD45047.1 Protein-L-isoaspartate (D-aspartate) O-methyltransferase [Stackebrandtia nassauensis DSM 44728]
MRNAMVDGIVKWAKLSDATAAAMRKVERHRFVPAATLKEAYTDDTVVTRRDEAGIATSSASAPWLQGMMLDQLELRPGMTVLEIGAGTGVNAGYVTELVGPSGHVTTIDIQPDVAEDARTALALTGATNVEVICGDGEYGYPANAPYDRVIATAGAWDIPEHWVEQLKPDGLMVVPLRMNGLTRSVAFTRDEHGVWHSKSAVNCGFMPVRGDGEVIETNVQIAKDVVVRIDDGQDLDVEALKDAIADSGEVEWTGILIDAPLDLLDFYMADMDGFCRILAPPSIAERGLAEPMNGWGSMGAATPDAVGYLTKRYGPLHPKLYELGTCAYGPQAQAMVDELTKRVYAWDRARKSVTGVHIEIHPSGQGDTADALMTIDKRHSRVIVRPA